VRVLSVLEFRIVAVLVACCTIAAAQQRRVPDLNQIVSNMEAARLRSRTAEPFLLTREYRMFHGEERQPASEVKAEINVVPPNARDYRIVESKGSGRGEKVVRRILDHEAQAEKRTPPPTAIIRENYDFAFGGEQDLQGARCYVLLLQPKREDTSLVKGRAWVDARSFLIRKVEGEMAKSPSWWVKDVKLSVQFGDFGGVWTQTSSDAVADVRWLGRYTVNGRVTKLETVTAMAADHSRKKLAPQNRRSLPAEAVYGTGVLVTH
jgi:hypothetical protein